MEVMTTQPPLGVEATLSGSAAKLLVHLLVAGDGVRSKAALMRLAGISDQRTLEKAQAELEARGWWPVARFLGAIPQSSGIIPQSIGIITDSSGIIPLSAVAIPQSSGIIPMQTVLDSTDTLTEADFARGMQALRGVPAEERNFSEVSEKFALALCQEADRMPADGDPLRSNSPFQLRRTAQVEALRKAYSQLCPEQTPLTIQRAKELLVAAENVAESAYEALEAAAGKEYPFNYARKILLNRPKRPEDHSNEYLEWTPELRAKQEAGEAKMRAMNLPAYFFGDDDDE